MGGDLGKLGGTVPQSLR